MKPPPTAEEALVRAGVISESQARAVRERLDKEKLPGAYFPQAVVDLGFAGKRDTLSCLSRSWALRPEDLSAGQIDFGLLDPNRPFQGILPYAFCKTSRILPLYVDDALLIAACAAPLTFLQVDEIALRTARVLEAGVALAGELDRLLAAADPANARVGPGSDIRSIEKRLLAEGKVEEAGELAAAAAPSVLRILLEGTTPLLPRERLIELLRQAVGRQESILEAAVELGFVEKGTLLRALSAAWGTPFVDLEKDAPDLETVRRLRTDSFIWDSVLPLSEGNGGLRLAMRNPRNRLLIEHIEKLTGKKVRPLLALDRDIRRVLDEVRA